MKVKVHIPFTDRVTGKAHKPGDVIELTAERLAEVKAVNVNMVSVLEEDAPKPKRKKKEE